MDIAIPSLEFGFSIGLAKVASFALGLVLMFFFDRWVLGRRVRKDLKDVRKALKQEEGKNIALEARMSVLERRREAELAPTSGQPHPPVNGTGTPSPDVHAQALANIVDSDEDVWRRSPGAGRITARLMMKAPDLVDAERFFDGFRAAPAKEHADWANWALLFRLEEAGRDREVFERAFDLSDEGGFLEDTESQRELQRLYDITRRAEQ